MPEGDTQFIFLPPKTKARIERPQAVLRLRSMEGIIHGSGSTTVRSGMLLICDGAKLKWNDKTAID